MSLSSRLKQMFEKPPTTASIDEMRDKADIAGLTHIVQKQYPLSDYAIKALGTLKDDSVLDFLVSLLSDKRDTLYADPAEKALEQYGSKAVEPLLNFLQKGIYHERTVRIIRLLGKIGDKRGIEPLIDLLKNERFDKGLVISALGEIGGGSAIETLLQVLNNRDISDSIKRKAINAMGYFRDKRAVESLLNLLEDPSISNDIKSEACYALGEIGDLIAFDSLMKQYKEGSMGIKREAIKAIGKLGDVRVVDEFIGLLKEPEFFSEVAQALGDLKDIRAVEPLLRQIDFYFNGYANEDIFHKQGRMVIQLGEQHYYWSTGCKAIVEALGKIGDVRALRVLDSVRDVYRNSLDSFLHKQLNNSIEVLLIKNKGRIQ